MLTTNLDVTYGMVWIIVLSNIIAVAVSFTFLNQLVRLTYVQATLLVPFLMVLVAFGAYTAHNSLADILVMLGATVVGIVAIRWDWPRAPLLLALVLGGIAERYLFLSYSLYEWSWLTRPLVIGFALVIVGGVVWPIVRDGRGHRNGNGVGGVGGDFGAGVGASVSLGAPPSAPARVDLLITLGFLAAGAWVVFQALDWPFRTSLFPLMTGSLLVGLALLKLGASVRRVAPVVQDNEQSAPADLPDVFVTASRSEWIAAVSWMTGFFLMLWLLGALVTVPLFAVAYLLLFAVPSPKLVARQLILSFHPRV